MYRKGSIMGKAYCTTPPPPALPPPPPFREMQLYALLLFIVSWDPFSNLCEDMVSRIDLSKGGPSLGRGGEGVGGAIWDNILLIIKV